MNAILIIAHAPLAHALRQCALHVFPDCGPELAAIDVQPNLPPEETLATARIAMDQLTRAKQVNGVLVLTDIFGATPSNVAQKLGRTLSYDPVKKVVPGDAEATALLRRPYRGPWKHPFA